MNAQLRIGQGIFTASVTITAPETSYTLPATPSTSYSISVRTVTTNSFSEYSAVVTSSTTVKNLETPYAPLVEEISFSNAVVVLFNHGDLVSTVNYTKVSEGWSSAVVLPETAGRL